MSTSAPFHELLTEHLKKMQAPDGEDSVTQAALARELVRRCIPTTKQAVHDWCHGRSRPESWKWSTLLDALGIPFTDRERWTDALTAKPARLQATAADSSAA